MVHGPTMFDWEETYDTYLIVAPVKGESLIGSQVKLKWLRENMLPLGEEPTEEELHAHYKVYILSLIGGVLMFDRTVNRVLNFRNVPHNNLVGYRSMIDHIQVDQVIDKMLSLKFYLKILNFNTNFLITMTYCNLNGICTRTSRHRFR